MKVVAFIPVKLNNERLPGKNTMRFSNGDPLISYILKTLHSVKNVDSKYVYCSSEDIIPYLTDDITFLKRDQYYDLSTTPFNEVLFSFQEQVDADVYVLTHATAPFINAESIMKGISAVTSGEYDSALSVAKMQEFLWKAGKPINYDVTRIPRTQDLEPYYRETCGLYIYEKKLMKQEKRRVGNRPYLVEVSAIEAIDINTYEDFVIADIIYQARRNDMLPK